MKKLIICLILVSMIILISCGNQFSESGNEVISTTESTSEINNHEIISIESVEKLTELDYVVSVDKVELEYGNGEILSYKMCFLSDGLKLISYISVPADYAEKDYPVLLYFPDVTTAYERIEKSFVSKGVIVIATFERGLGGSEGINYLGGSNIADALLLLQMCKEVDFINRDKIFVAGSAGGSITVLRMLQNDKENLIKAAAITSCMTDLIDNYENETEERKEHLYVASIGGTPEELPDEYYKRSAVNFVDDINSPLLILYYADNEFSRSATAIDFAALMEEKGKVYKLTGFDYMSTDFVTKDSVLELLSWINANI
ncbi:MAG: prolyl oligopeptidase family serine peptidase [Eubacteriales bacterium]